MALQNQDKYVLRLPDGLRDELKAFAAANNRSMNAEVLARLAASGEQRTLRDWFAGQALTGLLQTRPQGVDVSYTGCATLAYMLADTMLAERAKGGA